MLHNKINILGSFNHMEENWEVLKICFLRCHFETGTYSTFGEGLRVKILKIYSRVLFRLLGLRHAHCSRVCLQRGLTTKSPALTLLVVRLFNEA